MNRLSSIVPVVLLAAPPVSCSSERPGEDAANTFYMDIPAGRVVIALCPDPAPYHVAWFKALAAAGFHDGTPFHRVIDGFIAQGGDPTGTGGGSSDLPDLEAEFTATRFVRGSIGAARAADPNSAT